MSSIGPSLSLYGTVGSQPGRVQRMAAWLVLILIYALFIPNATRRAALVLGSLAAAPVLLEVFGRVRCAAVAEVVSTGDLVRTALLMTVAAELLMSQPGAPFRPAVLRSSLVPVVLSPRITRLPLWIVVA